MPDNLSCVYYRYVILSFQAYKIILLFAAFDESGCYVLCAEMKKVVRGIFDMTLTRPDMRSVDLCSRIYICKCTYVFEKYCSLGQYLG